MEGRLAREKVQGFDAKMERWSVMIAEGLKSGTLSGGALDWFLALPKAEREILMASAMETQRFTLLAELGVVEVPKGYRHEVRLAAFARKSRAKLNHCDSDIADHRFADPSRVLKPGDRLRVRAFRPMSRTVSSEECMAFLARQGAVHPGAQGLSLVFEQRRNQMPKGYWYASFDVPHRLPRAAGEAKRQVPVVILHTDGDIDFDTGIYESGWEPEDAFLCFTEAA
jgi:hypothetical protein